MVMIILKSRMIWQNQGGDPDEIEKFRNKFEKCLSFQKKLYQEPYVNTIIGSLKHVFCQEGIMEEFDTNNELIGFENGIYDHFGHNLLREEEDQKIILCFQQRLFYRSMVLDRLIWRNTGKI